MGGAGNVGAYAVQLAAQTGLHVTATAAKIAHEMLAGAPHKRGKIVLSIAA